jgi:quercetin dioxygenase-like cupin family protein
MKPLICLAATLSLALAWPVAASAHDASPAPAAAPPYTVTPVIQQALSDPALKNYELLAVTLDIVPGGTDAAPHRHYADLFVYVLEGSVEVELEGRGKSVHRRDEMFPEPRNALHSLLRNVDPKAPARVLAVFVIGKGRQFYVPAGN